MSPETVSTRPLLDKLGVKPGARIAVRNLADPAFMKLLRQRTADITMGRPKGPCDIVFLGASTTADLNRIKVVKSWIEPNGAIWGVRPTSSTPGSRPVWWTTRSRAFPIRTARCGSCSGSRTGRGDGPDQAGHLG